MSRRIKSRTFPINSSSESLPEYPPLDDLVTRSRGLMVRVIPEVRGR